MKIALVGPEPVPPAFGGVENVLFGLRDQIPALSPHQVVLIRLPAPERSFWEVVESYRTFWKLDVGSFDAVISTKYPAWMVRHPRHVCYLHHRLRGLYDTYPGRETVEPMPRSSPLEALIAHLRSRHTPRDDDVEELFDLLDDLREAEPGLPTGLFRFPGPLLRDVVRFLDGRALASDRICAHFAISETVAARDEYFPLGIVPAVVYPPTRLTGLRDRGHEYLFSAGRLDSAKRFDLLVDAMARVRSPVSLRIAGTGPEEAALRARAAGDPRISFLGFVGDDALADLYGRSLAVAYVPDREDYGLVTVEAMMSGKPVITCRDSGGPLELVEDGVNGLIVRPDAADVAVAIDRLAADAPLARELGQRGAERVRGITWEKTVRALLAPLTTRPARPRVARHVDSPSPITRLLRRPKVTVAVPFGVYPAGAGGSLRVFALCRQLARRFDVELVTLGHAGSEVIAEEIVPGLREIRIARSREHRVEEERVAQFRHLDLVADVAVAMLIDRTPDYGRVLSASMETADLVIMSHPYCLPAIEACPERPPLVYDAHNVELLLKRAVLERHAPALASLTEVVHEVESRACHTSVRILCCSTADGERLTELYGVPPEKRLLVPNGVDCSQIDFLDFGARARLRRGFGIDGRKIALFVGSWHPPNIQAVEDLLPMAADLPETVFLLAGSVCNAVAQWRLPRNVGLLGVVNDETLAAALSVAAIGLNPMPETFGGSGTNLKVATCLAAGLPLVTTGVGARGYEIEDERHALVRSMPDFPEAIRRLLADEALAASLAREGRRLAERRYDWSDIGERLARELRPLVRFRPGQNLADLVADVSSGIAALDAAGDGGLVASVAEQVATLQASESNRGSRTHRHDDRGEGRTSYISPGRFK